MDKAETLKVLTVLQVAYPRFYQNQQPEELKQAAALWQDMFSDQSLQVVGAAVKALIATSKFPPAIAEVKEYIQKVTEPQSMSAMEAWNLVRKAVWNAGDWNTQREFNKLPEAIRRVVGSSTQLDAWAQLPQQTFESVEQSHFIRSYDARQKTESEYERLPQSVKDFTKQLADGMGQGMIAGGKSGPENY